MNSEQIELKLPVKRHMELIATRVSETLTDIMGFSEEISQEISLSVLEACINSFEHANSKDDTVYIRFVIKDDELHIRIQDHGNGITGEDKTKLLESLAQNNFEFQKRGWGIKLMYNFMDEVNIKSNAQGTTVTMMKRKNGGNSTPGG